jgi:hypothetical protein
MAGRSSIGMAALDVLAARISLGEFENRPGVRLEVSISRGSRLPEPT